MITASSEPAVLLPARLLPAAPSRAAKAPGHEVADIEARAELMLAQLAVDSRAQDLRSGWTGRVAALGPATRFAGAVGIACLLVAALLLLTVVAGLLLE